MIVVIVKKKLGIACLIFLYLKLNKGIMYSIDQKKAIPPTSNTDLWVELIFSKKLIKLSNFKKYYAIYVFSSKIKIIWQKHLQTWYQLDSVHLVLC